LPLQHEDMLSRMSAEQPYAAGQPGWGDFCENLKVQPCFELRRTDPPVAAVQELRALLTSGACAR